MTSLDPSYIWDNYNLDELNNQLVFEKETLSFTLFNVNFDKIEKILTHLKEFLDPFIEHYPWFHSPPVFEQYKHNEISYIYGEFIYQDSLNDEWLLTNLLWEFLTFYPDLYIHLWDSSDFEFILVESSDFIPAWLEPNNSLNRAWINDKTVLIINPNQELNNLTLEEALDELLEANFQKYPAIASHLNEKLSKINDTFLIDIIYDLEISLPSQVLQIFAEKPYLVSQSISEFVKESLPLNQNLKSIKDDLLIPTKVGVPFLSLNLMKFKQLELQTTNAMEFEFGLLASKILTVGIDNIMRLNNCLLKISGKPSNLSRSVIQDKLIEQGRLTHHIPENTEIFNQFENMSEADVPTEFNESALIDRFNDFFKDTTAGLDGIDNTSDDEEAVDKPNYQHDKRKIDDDGDIDEDDFFEFFLKDALKLSDKDIEGFRNNTSPTNSKRKLKEFKEYSNDSDYQTDTSTEYDNGEVNDESDTEDDGEDVTDDENTDEEERYIKQFLQKLNGSNDIDGLTNLFKSINTDIGPGSVLLQQGISRKQNKRKG
ncbi:uncharacterized protein AC631_02579 [Debaryomyces fabryi]|uniref:Uncharacterized protein n=1 Tax=Debaryomyces fabryi TaxID=58627 RepID=A0A0V1PZH0_9ASCO|nr:uncharacterized protein AC631_02579 [Debaryomyces fabryi]KSA01639.1 hypothetical protein AC631_02579 [Debaryomyces fabryi]CUM45422.1 unnamed protein product [Debaryomyces fabryi]